MAQLCSLIRILRKKLLWGANFHKLKTHINKTPEQTNIPKRNFQSVRCWGHVALQRIRKNKKRPRIKKIALN